MMKAEKNQYYQLKTQYNIDIAINQNWKLKLHNILESDKLTNEHDLFSEDRIYTDLDHTKSQHTRALQKSDYVQIEHRKEAIQHDLQFIIG